MGALTILSGANASGKSTVLQALVLLHQTMSEHEWSNHLLLNGKSLQLGTVTDVVDQIHGRDSFELGICDKTINVHWCFKAKERRDMSLVMQSVAIDENIDNQLDKVHYLFPHDKNEISQSLANRIRNLTYLTAERVGPREIYPLFDPNVTHIVGPRGENTAGVLHGCRDYKVAASLILPNETKPQLQAQVETRMRMFFPGCRLDIQPIIGANAVSLGLRTSDDTEFHRPINIGFGLTQILPIVVAALSSQPEDILLIENPEVHLHPAGQALMGQFLAEMAQAGLQVIVETHSDHILNGVRRYVKTGKLKPEQVMIHFFRMRNENKSQVESPILDSQGNINFWPEGFFDQFDKDINYFADWGENNGASI